MPVINLAYVFELALKYARKYAYSIAVISFYSIIFAMFASFVVSFIAFYNLINTFLAFSASSSGELISKVYGLLSCIGFTSALNYTKSLLISGVLFLLWRIVYAQVVSVYFQVLRIIAPLVK